MTKEEETDDAEVHDGLGSAWLRVILESLFQGLENGEVDRPDSQGGWVSIIPSLEEGSEAVDIAGAVHLEIGEVQPGELLAHGTYGFRHSFRSDGLHTTVNESAVVVVSKHNEEVEVQAWGTSLRKGPWPWVAQKAIQYMNRLAQSDCVAGMTLCRVASIAASSSELKASQQSGGTCAKVCPEGSKSQKG